MNLCAPLTSIRALVEALFAHTYLILFGKLAAGGLLALAVPPFHEMERGFYKSTGVVYAFMAYIMAAGDAYLVWTYGTDGPVGIVGLIVWVIFALLFTAYVATLYVEMPFLRARIFPAAVLAGFLALAITATGYVPAGASISWALPIAWVLMSGAVITGAAATGMLLGHWYLIDTGLDLGPLNRMYAFCRVCLGIEVAVVLVAAMLVALWPSSPFAAGVTLALTGRYVLLVLGRLLAWALAALLLMLIGRTLAIPQTMAATGLFYILALTVAVGQIVAQWLLFRTGAPL